MKRSWISVHASVALLSLAIAAGPSSARAQEQKERPTFGAGVTLVAVPVFVTDKSGRSVGGLTAEDFEIEDGGKKVPIVSFQAIDVDAPKTAESQAEIAALPAAVQAAGPRQFLLLFDLGFSPSQGIIRGRAAGMAFVKQALAPGDLVAAVTTSRQGLKVLSEFTTDHEQAARAIASLGLTGTYGTALLGEAGDLGAGASGRMAEELAEMQADLNIADQFLYKQTVNFFLDDLSQLVKMLSPLRGRKQVVLLSAGFRGWLEDPPMLGRMNDLFKSAGLGDVVIHTISLDGIETGPGRDALVRMSNETGGRFIMPRNDFSKALGEVERISRQSYVLAFEAADATPKGNKPRNLKVRVRGAGLSVSHRPVYSLSASPPPRDVDAAKRQAESALGHVSEAPLRLRLNTLAYHGASGPSVHAVLQIQGPALDEATRAPALAIQVYGYALRDGTVLDSLALNTSLDTAKLGEAVRKSGISLIASFPASPGNTELRFFVRSGAAGVTGSIQRNLTVPAFGEGLVLSAPMFALAPAGRVVAPMRSEKRAPIKIPFYVGDAPFVPDPAPVLTAGTGREVCVFVWHVASAPDSRLEVAGEISSPGGPARPLRIEGAPRVVPDADGTDRYLVTVIPPDLPSGPYTLRLTFKDPGTGVTSSSEIAVGIEK